MDNTDSDSFCILPWMHFHLSPNGEVHSCCRTDFENPLGSFEKNSLKEIWNQQPIRELRLQMLQGKKVSNCEDCYQQERNNQISMRKSSNENWKSYYKLVKETKPDGTVETFEPAYLDLRFNNICNYKCRTCGPHFSTSWFDDFEQLNWPIDEKKKTPAKNEDKLWNELLDIVPHVKQIYFAGGEPLIQKDHYTFLDHLQRMGRKDIILCYNTNLSTLNFGGKNILDYWNKFDDVWVHASIDGILKKGEYIRKGMVWDELYQNRMKIKEKCPNVKFVVYWTMSALNAFHFIEALDFFMDKKFIDDGKQIAINMLNSPTFYNVQVFNEEERDNLKTLYKLKMKELKANAYPNTDYLIEQLQYVLDYMDAGECNPIIRKSFWAFNNKIDRIRKENFLNLFPELKSLYEVPLSIS
jgi:radical SAM protein with 4Fe4S-binding SPASM domain